MLHLISSLLLTVQAYAAENSPPVCPATIPFAECRVREFCENCDDVADWRKLGAEGGIDLPVRTYKLRGYPELVKAKLTVMWGPRQISFDRPITFKVNGGTYVSTRLTYDPAQGVILPARTRQDLVHQFKSLAGIEVISASSAGIAGTWRLTKPMNICSVTWPAGTQFADWENGEQFAIRPLQSFKSGKMKIEAKKVYEASQPRNNSKAPCELLGPHDASETDFDWDLLFSSKASKK